MYTINKEFRFEAAHQLHGMPQGHQCARMHGHSYRIEVEIRSATVNEVGFVVDFGELKPIKQWLDDTIDHRVLNDITETLNPTAENLAHWLFSAFYPVIDSLGARLTAVKVHETATAWAEYRP